MLKLKHFDCRLNQWIENPNKPEETLTEELDNALLEKFFPDSTDKFSIGHIDQYSKVEDLQNHPQGDVLLLSSGTRLLYGPAEYLEKIQQICPDPKDRGAYGSLFIGNCPEEIEGKFNILVVDDEGVPVLDEDGNPTGEWEVEPGGNGGILPNPEAFKLVGDCHGKIAPELAAQLAEGKTDRVIQHRMQFGELRLGKGTLAPWSLENLAPNAPRIDIVLPASSFKGGDKTNDPIQPGLYTDQQLWMGRKDLSPENSKVAISQFIPSFPKGIEDLIERSEEQARELIEVQKDPRELAKAYLKNHEDKQKNLQNSDEEIEQEQETEDLLIYQIIKQDIESGHPQLLETQKVQNELEKYVRTKWRDIAIGKSLKFDRALIIPSKNLKEGEICDTRFNEGEELLNFRSPFLNSNGMCVDTNKYVPEAYAPDGTPLKGVIVVSDETLERIAARQRQNGEDIDLPLETESQRQGRDFDGDCIGIAKASDYPILAAEAIERNRPENAYAPTVKEKKMSFSNPDGTGWTFERIAHFMSDGISVGSINNVVVSAVTLESEAEMIRDNGSFEEKLEYCRKQYQHYSGLKEAEISQKTDFVIPNIYRDKIENFIEQFPQDPTEESLNRTIDLNRTIYRELIQEASYQNQIAVDMFKSARKPDVERIRKSSDVLYRQVPYIKEKKQEDIYTNRNNKPKLISVAGASPTELLIAQTNQLFEQSSLESRPTIQFRNLFTQTYTPQQLAAVREKKTEFDRAFNTAKALSDRLKTEEGPQLKVKVKGLASEFEISNLYTRDGNHPLLDKNPIQIEQIRLVPNPKPNARSPHRLMAIAPVPGTDKFEKLGTVVESDRIANDLNPGQAFKVEYAYLTPALDKRSTDLLFTQAFDNLEAWSASIPSEERAAYAAAAWHVGTNRESSNKQSEEELKASSYKLSNFSFYAFKKELVERVANYQIDRFSLSGIDGQAIAELQGQPTAVEFISAPEPGKAQIKTPEGKILAYTSETGPQLPLSTTATGTITLDTAATAIVSHPQLNGGIKINKISAGDFANSELPNNADMTLRLESSRYPTLLLNGQKLGRLDNNSVEILRDAGKLDGTPIKATINTEGKKAVLKLEDGTTISTAQNYSYYARQKFNNQQVEVNFALATENKTIYASYIGDRKLGEISDKAAIAALQQAGINRDGQILSGIQIQSNPTQATLTLDTETIEYPKEGEWQQRTPSDRRTTAIANTPEIVKNLQETFTKRPSFAFERENAIFLVVDRKTAARAVEYFQKEGCHVATPNPDSYPIEIARGYQPIALSKAELSEELQAQIAQQAKTIYPSNEPGGDYQRAMLAQTFKKDLDRVYPPPLARQMFEPIAAPESEIAAAPQIEVAVTPEIKIHTDGSCLNNPGPGGWAAIIERQNPETGDIERTEIMGSEFVSTNNRMELTAAIEALRAIDEPSNITLNTDSQYLIDTIEKGWQRNSNQDLWAQLDIQLAKHTVKFEWVKAHSGNELNERCDRLAKEAAQKAAVPPQPAVTTTLNGDQKIAFDKLLAFIENPGDRTAPQTNEFLLTGEAGTGKTYLIAQLCRSLAESHPNLEVAFTAPTHQAVGVLKKFAEAQNLDASAMTTHKLLSLKQKIDPISGEISFSPENPPNISAQIIIVDETSMINTDLAAELEALPLLGKKVIYMGDPKQLPPVGETESPIFKKEFSDRAHLTEVVRYGGQIGEIARNLSANIEAKDHQWLTDSADGQIENAPVDRWLDRALAEFSSPAFESDKSHIRILTYTNARKSDLNAAVREHLLGKDLPEYQAGDFIRANDTFNAQGSTFENSEEAVLRRAEKTLDPETKLTIWKLTIERDNGNTLEIPVVASESQKEYKSQLDALKQKARSSTNLARKPAWQEYYRLEKKFAQIDYGYACTIHKSQGSTYTKVAIDEGNVISHYSKHPDKARERNQLFYVALARAKEGVLTSNPMAVKEIDAVQHPPISGPTAETPAISPTSNYNYNNFIDDEEGGVSFDFDIDTLTPPDEEYNRPAQPQPQSEKTSSIAAPINIWSGSDSPLGAALTNPTETAHYKGKIQQHYPVSFAENPERQADTSHKAEKYFQPKPAGEPFLSAEDAFQALRHTTTPGEGEVNLMAEIIAAKLEQHPQLKEAIAANGGTAWLETCEHNATGGRSQWEGTGRESPFMRALIAGYELTQTRETTQTQQPTQPMFEATSTPSNPIETTSTPPQTQRSRNVLDDVQPINPAVARHAIKDRAMAEVATQFIGHSAAPENVASSTREYEAAWGDRANTGKYTSQDVVMVSGSGPWRGVSEAQIQATFESHYQPLLDAAIAAKTSIVVGDAAGTDKLVQSYLQERNYQVKAGQNYKTCDPQLESEVAPPKPQSEIAPPITHSAPAPKEDLKIDTHFPGLPPLTAAYNGEKIAEQLARTEQAAPLVAGILNAMQSTDYTGSQYRATWDEENKALKLFGVDGSLKMTATISASGDCWEAQPLPDGLPPVGLSADDLTSLQKADAQIKRHLAENFKTNNKQAER